MKVCVRTLKGYCGGRGEDVISVHKGRVMTKGQGKPDGGFKAQTFAEFVFTHKFKIAIGKGQEIRQIHLGLPGECRKCASEIARFHGQETEWDAFGVRFTRLGTIGFLTASVLLGAFLGITVAICYVW